MGIKKAYDRFQPLKHLMTEEMVSHKFLAERVACITYGNGERIIVNRSPKEYDYQGIKVMPGTYSLMKATASRH